MDILRRNAITLQLVLGIYYACALHFSSYIPFRYGQYFRPQVTILWLSASTGAIGLVPGKPRPSEVFL